MFSHKDYKKFQTFKHSIQEHRAKVATLFPKYEPAKVDYFDALVSISDVTDLPIRVYRPHTSALMPTIFYVPGTAFVARELAFTDVICSHLAEKSKCQVIILDHRLAPENKFPCGLEDASQLLINLLKLPAKISKIDKHKIAIVGYSSGGNFATSMVMAAQGEGFEISKQILVSPMVDLSRQLTEFKQFEDKDTTITNEFVEWFLSHYVPEKIDLKNPRLSPFWYEEIRLSKLPPTDIIYAEFDRFRSDAEAYYEKLKSTKATSVNKLLIEKEDHSFLWYKLEVIEIIGKRIEYSLEMSSVPRNYFDLDKKEEPEIIEEADSILPPFSIFSPKISMEALEPVKKDNGDCKKPSSKSLFKIF